MEDYLFLVHREFNLRIHSFVLMPNHFHLLVSSPDANLSEAMTYFMGKTAKEITSIAGQINQTYGGRHHKSMISSHHYFMTAYKYVYRNPVRAGLCKLAEEYRYSTLSGLCGVTRLRIPIENDMLLFSPSFDQRTLSCLNQPPKTQNDDDLVRKALKKMVYEYGLTKNSESPDLCSRLY